MREISSHRPGRIFLLILAVSLFWYVFIVPFVVQNNNYLFLGWIPLVVIFWNIQTILWLVATYIYTTKYWPYR
jgi:hypothetical protein